MFRALVLSAAAYNSATVALGTNYIHDGKTTYCWAIPQPPKYSNLTEDQRTTTYSGPQQCPLNLAIELSALTVRPFAVVNFTWTVTADFTQGNAINNTKLVLGLDAAGTPAQIVHSNVHSCVFGTGCDPFSNGKELVDKTTNKVANFTDNKALFADSLIFTQPGEYSVLAHIILPDENVSHRYDYAVYNKVIVTNELSEIKTNAPLVVNATPVAVEEKSKTSSMSTEMLVGIIVGGVVVTVAIIVLGIFVCRRREGSNNHAPTNHSDPFELKSMERTQPESMMDTNNTIGYQSAHGSATTNIIDIDTTMHSNGSYSSYATPSEHHRNHAYQSNSQRAPIDSEGFYSSGERRKRVDSDVEL